MRLLVVLQCAYATTEKRREQLQNKRPWLRSLWSSHTGQILRTMLPEGWEVRVMNASPKIGEAAGVVFEPDADHIRREVEDFAPDVILGCGKVAQRGLAESGYSFVAAPHPAWRALTREHRAAIRAGLEELR